MAMRFESRSARRLGLVAIVRNVTETWRAEDEVRRGGRRSYADPVTLPGRFVRYQP